MDPNHITHLLTAIEVARAAREHGNHPFGAILVDAHGQVLLRAENTVNTEKDATGHAETNLVRLASRHYTPSQLAECTLYTSTEPCAMCSGAIHWSGIGRIVFALSEPALYDMVGPSPEHLLLPSREVFLHTRRPIEILGPATEIDSQARSVHLGFWR